MQRIEIAPCLNATVRICTNQEKKEDFRVSSQFCRIISRARVIEESRERFKESKKVSKIILKYYWNANDGCEINL